MCGVRSRLPQAIERYVTRAFYNKCYMCCGRKKSNQYRPTRHLATDTVTATPPAATPSSIAHRHALDCRGWGIVISSEMGSDGAVHALRIPGRCPAPTTATTLVAVFDSLLSMCAINLQWWSVRGDMGTLVRAHILVALGHQCALDAREAVCQLLDHRRDGIRLLMWFDNASWDGPVTTQWR